MGWRDLFGGGGDARGDDPQTLAEMTLHQTEADHLGDLNPYAEGSFAADVHLERDHRGFLTVANPDDLSLDQLGRVQDVLDVIDPMASGISSAREGVRSWRASRNQSDDLIGGAGSQQDELDAYMRPQSAIDARKRQQSVRQNGRSVPPPTNYRGTPTTPRRNIGLPPRPPRSSS